MDIGELYHNIIELIPYRGDNKESYYYRLHRAFKKYRECVDSLIVQGQLLNINERKTIHHICDKIEKIVKNCLKGLTSTAFTQLHNLLANKYKGEESMIDMQSNLFKIEPHHEFLESGY